MRHCTAHWPASWSRLGRWLDVRAAMRGHGDVRRHAHAPLLQIELLEARQVFAGESVVAPMWFASVGGVEHERPALVGGLSIDGDLVIDWDASEPNPNEVYDWIVRFADDAITGLTSVADTATLFAADNVNFDIVRGLGIAGQVLVRTAGSSVDAVVDWLAANVHVATYELDIVQQFQATPNDAAYASLWGMENTGQSGGRVDADIDAAAAWNISTGSSSVVVGVIDTGIDYRHVDLASNMWRNPGEIAGNGVDDDGNGFVDDVYGYDFANNDGDPLDDHGHGTHVAGTIGAAGNNGVGVAGVNWSSSLMALKFLSGSGSGYTSDAVRAVNYATMMRNVYGVNVRVTNNSWGGGGYSTALKAAIDASGASGILFVAAAGNNGLNNDTSPHYPSSYASTNIIAVAATDRYDNLAGFSNYGATSVDVAAPGVSIYSTVPNNGYSWYNGTSMASPHVAGIAALAWSVAPGATVADVRNAILQGVDTVAGLSGKVATGGRVNAYNTLQLLNRPPEIAVFSGSLEVFDGTPQVVDFGSTLVGRTVDRTFTVRNSGGDPLQLTSPITLPAGFSLVSGFGATTLTAGQQTTFTVRYNAAAPATAVGQISFNTNDADESTFNFNISARADASMVVDNSDMGYSETGAWGGVASGFSYGYQNDVRWHAAGNGSSSASWSFSGIANGTYEVFTTWYSWTDRATNAPYSVYDGAQLESVVTVNQRLDPASAAYDGKQWHSLGRFVVDNGSLRVALSDNANGWIIADAVRITPSNATPTIAPLADIVMSRAEDFRTVTVSIADPEGNPVTRSAQAFVVDANAQAAYDLDQRLGLYYPGSDHTNARGMGEKYVQGAGGTWYYILPSGELYVWGGSVASSSLIATLNNQYHADSSRLYNAAKPAATVATNQVALSFSGNQLTVNPNASFAGVFTVVVSATDGNTTGQRSFQVTVQDTAPVLTTVGDRAMSHNTDKLVIALASSDAENNPRTYSAQFFAADPTAQIAYELNQQLGLVSPGSYYTNHRGHNEKYLQGTGGTWYYMLPEGELFIWGGSIEASTRIATLDAGYYADPSKLHESMAPAATALPGDAVVSVSGNQLTIDPRSGFAGEFFVRIAASDGVASDSEVIRVTVSNSAPSLAAIADQAISHSENTRTLPLSFADADGDTVTLSASVLVVDALAQQVYDLDQRLGLCFPGSDYTNARGMGEKYVQGEGGTWYYILPGGDLYVWGGSVASSTLVAALSGHYHADVSRLYNAAAPTAVVNAVNVSAAINGSQLTIDPAPGFAGSVQVRVTASDGVAASVRTFNVDVGNSAPALAAVANQQLAAHEDKRVIGLTAPDADGDNVTYSARLLTSDPAAQQVYELDQRLGLYAPDSYYRDARGMDEVYLRGTGGTWYFLLPTGELYVWGGSVAASSMVDLVDPMYNAAPHLLATAALPATTALAGDVALSLAGNQLTIDPRSGYTGAFHVEVAASDGAVSASRVFRVQVGAGAASANGAVEMLLADRPAVDRPSNISASGAADALTAATIRRADEQQLHVVERLLGPLSQPTLGTQRGAATAIQPRFGDRMDVGRSGTLSLGRLLHGVHAEDASTLSRHARLSVGEGSMKPSLDGRASTVRPAAVAELDAVFSDVGDGDNIYADAESSVLRRLNQVESLVDLLVRS